MLACFQGNTVRLRQRFSRGRECHTTIHWCTWGLCIGQKNRRQNRHWLIEEGLIAMLLPLIGPDLFDVPGPHFFDLTYLVCLLLLAPADMFWKGLCLSRSRNTCTRLTNAAATPNAIIYSVLPSAFPCRPTARMARFAQGRQHAALSSFAGGSFRALRVQRGLWNSA